MRYLSLVAVPRPAFGRPRSVPCSTGGLRRLACKGAVIVALAVLPAPILLSTTRGARSLAVWQQLILVFVPLALGMWMDTLFCASCAWPGRRMRLLACGHCTSTPSSGPPTQRGGVASTPRGFGDKRYARMLCSGPASCPTSTLSSSSPSYSCMLSTSPYCL